MPRTESSPPESKNHTFSLDLKAIKARARTHLEAGAVTEANKLDHEVIVQLLNDSLATELVCVLRYRAHHAISASIGGIAGHAVTEELLQHALEEQGHADKLSERILQLGGTPDFNPSTLAGRSHTDYEVGESLRDILTEDLVAERIAIETYSAIIRFIADKDTTTRRLLEGILEMEEEHADELADFLRRVPING